MVFGGWESNWKGDNNNKDGMVIRGEETIEMIIILIMGWLLWVKKQLEVPFLA